jgi:DNA-binding CsgD family transcriptional regulator
MDSPPLGCGKNYFRAPSAPGFLVLDATNKPLYSNAEAVRVLTYSLPRKEVEDLGKFLSQAIPLMFLDSSYPIQSAITADFRSGRRRYVCRLVPLVRSSGKPSRGITGLLIERYVPKSVNVSAAAQQFHLTHREQQTVTFLMDGLTSKEIANRMNVSPNTVKTFVRFIMTKMTVSTRSGIVGKFARP